MRGIVYTGEDAEVTDELEVRTRGRRGPRRHRGRRRVPQRPVGDQRDHPVEGAVGPRPRGRRGGRVGGVGGTSVKPGDHVVIATLASCGDAGPAAPATPPGASRRLGNVSQPFTFKGEPASNFAGTSVFTEAHRRQGGAGGQDLEGRAHDLGLPHRLRRADRRRLGAQPGQGPGRGDRGRLRRGGCGAQRDPGPPARRAPAGSSPSTPWLPRRVWPASSGPPTSSTPLSTDAVAAIRGSSLPARPGRPGALGGPAASPGPSTAWAIRRCSAMPWTSRLGRQRPGHRHPASGHRGLGGRQCPGLCRPRPAGLPLRFVPPHHDIPLMVELYLSGKLMLDELVTEERPLEGFRRDRGGHGGRQVGPGCPDLLRTPVRGPVTRAVGRAVSRAGTGRDGPVTVGTRYDGASD